MEIARLLHKYGPHRKGPCVEIQFYGDSIAESENELFFPDGRWGEALERAKGGTLILQGIEKMDASVAHRLVELFGDITDSMRIIALEGCAGSLLEDPVEMNRSLYAAFATHVVRLPEFSERTEDLVQIIQAVAASPIQYGLARLLEEDEVEQIAEELKLYDFEGNFLGLFERIRRMADRTRRTFG